MAMLVIPSLQWPETHSEVARKSARLRAQKNHPRSWVVNQDIGLEDPEQDKHTQIYIYIYIYIYTHTIQHIYHIRSYHIIYNI